MSRSVAQKMGVKEGARAHLVAFPDDVLDDVGLPELDIVVELTGKFDYIHLFVVHATDFEQMFPLLKQHLQVGGMLWVSWPKAKKMGTDLTLPKVIERGYRHGLVESTCLSVNGTWSGLKFTWPKPGKVYANSFGTLPEV